MIQTVIDDIIPRTQIISTAGQLEFNTNWTADVATDIDVYARLEDVPADDILQLVNSSNYVVTFVGDERTVRVTFLLGRTLGDVITIVRNTPAERMNLYINTNFVPSMLNEDFGILTLVDQQAQLYDTVINPGYNLSAFINQVDKILPTLGPQDVWRMNENSTAIEAYTLDAVPSNSDAPFVIYKADDDLDNAFNLGLLTSGLLKQSVVAGISTPEIAVLGIDYYGPGMLGYIQAPAGIKDVEGNIVVDFRGITDAVNYFDLFNSASGVALELAAKGADANVNITYRAKGTGSHHFISTDSTTPIIISTGTSSQHTTEFTFSDTAAARRVTWQDADGTLAFLSDVAGSVSSVLGTANRITSTGGTTPVIDISGSYVASLANGGTNASLTASNGGIFYSTATAGAILAGTATAGQILRSGANTTPAWSSASYPAVTTINRILYSSAANTIGEIITANSGLLVTSATGVPSIGNAILKDITVNGLTVGRGSPAGTPVNTAFGVNALLSNVSGSLCTAIGALALTAATTASECVAVGHVALAANQAGNQLTAIGSGALSSSNSGSTSNTAVGWSCMSATTAPGSNNAMFGGSACTSASFTGAGNSGIGNAVFASLTSGNANLAGGQAALLSLTTGSNNCSLGYFSGYSNASGSVATTTGSNNTFIGFQAAGNSASISGGLALGSNAVADIATGSTSGTFGPGIAFGSATNPVGFRGDGTIIPPLIGDGSWKTKINGTYYYIPLLANAATALVTTVDMSINSVIAGHGPGGVIQNTVFGHNAYINRTAGAYTTAIGYAAAQASTTASQNVAVGSLTLLTNQTGEFTTAVGHAVLQNSTTTDQNTIIGCLAACNATAAGGVNTIVGAQALQSASFVSTGNCGLGYAIFSSLTSGGSHSGVGYAVFNLVTTATNNTGIGFYVGSAQAPGATAVTTGGFNTFVGNKASGNSAAIIGAIAIGSEAVADVSTGSAGPGIAIGSVGYKVGFNNSGALFTAAGTGGAITPPAVGAGYIRIKWNGTYYKFLVYPDA